MVGADHGIGGASMKARIDYYEWVKLITLTVKKGYAPILTIEADKATYSTHSLNS